MKQWSYLVALGSVLLAGSQVFSQLSGNIKSDGSSTVYLMTEAAATEFKKVHPNVNVSIGISGTGGGYRKFGAGETDIQNSSRRIKAEEAKAAKDNGVDYIELQIAWDGLSVVIHKDNDFAKKLTMDQLKKIWHPDLAAKTWDQVDPTFPKEPISLWGPGKDSGTFDFFTQVVNGKEKLMRQDYNASEDDNVLVTGVAKNKYAMGFFGLAYYEKNKDKLGVVALAEAKGEPYHIPSIQTVLSSEYPISRPLYIYVNTKSLKRPEVLSFVEFYVKNNGELAKKAGYVPLSSVQTSGVETKLKSALK
jgi:phosphate transport system substrate-binding protein